MYATRSIKNIFWGLTYQFIVLIFGLITPRLLLINYGSEINGMLSSIHQFYTYLSLLEAGIGAASLQALYKTVSINDNVGTNSILSATHYFYKKTSYYYLFCIILLASIYPVIVKTDIPSYICICVIVLTGLISVINFFYLAKYRILFQAEGKTYIFTNIGIGVYILSNIIKIILLNCGYNIVFVQFSYFIVNIFPCIFITFYIRNKYKWINLNRQPNFEAISQKKNVLVHQIADLIFYHTDVIILTVFCGLKVVSVYSLFAGLYGTLKSVLYNFLDGVKFVLGQLYNKDYNQFYKLFDIFELYYMSLTFAAYTTLQMIIIPFINIYTSGVNDILYTNYLVAYLFTSIYLIMGARGPVSLVVHFAGQFKQTQYQAINEMILNVSITLIGIYYIGIYGALLGTFVALIYRTFAVVIYVNKIILNRSSMKTLIRWLINVIIAILVIALSSKLALTYTSYLDVVKYGILFALFNLFVFFMIPSIVNFNTFKNTILFVNNAWFKTQKHSLHAN